MAAARVTFWLAMTLGGWCVPAAVAGPDYAALVDPLIGTGGHGHTFPGAARPFGLMQASPDTRLTGWDACSGYHYSDQFIYGFSHQHLSGVGIPDYSDILVMPQSGVGTVTTPRPEAGVPGYGATFSHAREHAEPGYYDVELGSGIGVALTATERAAMHRYDFPANAARSVVLDLHHRDLVLAAELTVVSPTEIAGFRRSSSWAEDQRIYFVLRFEAPVAGVQLYADDQAIPGSHATGLNLKALIRLPEGGPATVKMKVALSPVSVDGARKNLEAELPGWNFDAARAAARDAWNAVLGKIDLAGGSLAQRRTFYTALYHAYLSPNLFNDVDGRYVGRNGKIHVADHPYFTVFSLWDTFRAWHPLMTVLEPEASRDFVRTFLLMHQQGGLLPVWDLAGNETFCMIGNHAISVIADAYAKGIRGFDAELALAAMKHSVSRDQFGLGAYRRDGYLARDEERESVSKTLEYAYDDWCVAQLAGALGHHADEAEFLRRAQSYVHLFSPRERFFVARENGGWQTPFRSREINFNYTEGNAWHYRFSVPHDLAGLSELLGGDKAFGVALDELFNAPSDLEGREQPDVAGLIGQYAHGNEPCHNFAYLYNFVGRPSETQRRVREILATQYSDRPDGLSGNEDCGQMSAWFLFSALGFYPLTPGTPEYAIGSPLFERATLAVGGGRKFTVTARNQSAENVYLAAAQLNGVPLERSYLTHTEIMAGGELVLTMSPVPNVTWATASEARPHSRIDASRVVAAPAVDAPRSFRDEVTVALEPLTPGSELWFTLDGTEPVPGVARRYVAPFVLTATTHIRCVARVGERLSPVTNAQVNRIDGTLNVVVHNPVEPRYSAGGPNALIDGVLGGVDFGTGRWQGYATCDADITVDLGRVAKIAEIKVGFLEDPNVYILLPRQVTFEVSNDGQTFGPADVVVPPASRPGAREVRVVRVTSTRALEGRYLRVRAANAGLRPAWGSTELIPSFIFCDEIQIDHH